MKQFVAGFDPGGRDKKKKPQFGWCVAEFADSPNVIKKGTVACADEAFHEMHKSLNDTKGQLVATGIDSHLYWMRNGKRRNADSIVWDALKKELPSATTGRVQAVNSLQGACLIQGFFLAKKIESNYPYCKITETHPKVLLEISPKVKDYVNQVPSICNEHERDAIISAWAAAKCFLHGGKPNLFCFENKKDIHAFLEETIYWWPILNSSL